MKELDGFTVEQLNDFIKSDHTQCGDVAALARIALAAKRAEPVSLKSAIVKFKEYNIGFPVEKLKADFVISWCLNNLTPQLNSPEIPDSWKLVPIEPTQNMVDAHISGMQLAGFSRAYRDMLAAAPEPQNQQQNIPENIPQGWIKCSDHRPERGTDVQVYCSDTREQFVAFHIGNGAFQYAQHEDTSIACRPSHWMPLPAAPEKENG
ncbi:TPA: DUF551 domain-containing protein [Yersinia enterocolitica]|uniref:DUF551 domain-containing protein n=1 Tax=Yersinia enterocolitica TaxID=630 RepID=UPI0033013F17|nr:DUF551 domain-containing protein [Yersinia enterocolitica]HDM8317276.1 DUF551 domain-containing protein [Yersinia enterocolitica]